MKSHDTININLRIIDPTEVEEAKRLAIEIGRYWTQGAIYMCGLRYVAVMVRKAKDLGKVRK